MAPSASTFRPSSAARVKAIAFTSALVRERSLHRDTRSRISPIGKPKSRVVVTVTSITAVAPGRWRDQTDLFIMSDHALRDAAGLGGLADVHSLTRFSRSALPTTLTDDRAIAAAAMIGDSRMPKNGYNTPAATGTPAAL